MSSTQFSKTYKIQIGNFSSGAEIPEYLIRRTTRDRQNLLLHPSQRRGNGGYGYRCGVAQGGQTKVGRFGRSWKYVAPDQAAP
jgi:hypothetical protein